MCKKARSEGCFPANTAISTPCGLVPIYKLKEGDLVFSYDVSQQYLLASRILKAIKHPSNRIWEMTFDDICIRTTASHSFLVNDTTWKKASEIKSGDKIKFDNGFKRVRCSEQTTNIEDVYNLIVEENYNFIAEGVMAHSFSHFRAIRMLFYSFKTYLKRTINTSTPNQTQKAAEVGARYES